MPRLLALLVCEKVINDQQSVPSLIGVFQRINIPRTAAAMPPNAVNPMKWAIFTMWEHAPEEIGNEFVQRLQITKPNGEKFVDANLKFKPSDSELPQSKNTVEIFGIPVDREGDFFVRVWIEGYDSNHGDTRFNVKYHMKEDNESTNPKLPN